MKYIKSATKRMNLGEGRALDGEPSLLERVIKSQKDERLAVVMALDLILVGIDTISMAVCSILYQLATRPAEQQKVYEELKRIMPDPKTPLTYQLLDQAHYLKAFIKEVLRVYSTVIGNGRTLQEDTVICGYRIPKGVSIRNMMKHITQLINHFILLPGTMRLPEPGDWHDGGVRNRRQELQAGTLAQAQPGWNR